MIYETAAIDIRPGEEAAFEAAMAEAAPYVRAAKGLVSIALHRIIEKPSTYRLFAGWQTVEDHMAHFRTSSAFQEWRRLAAPFFAGPPRVDHVEVRPLGG